MKRFTNDGRNEQEGWELIPAHRNAEEEAPLGLSFGGVAEARTLSRRQALGLLGGSLAGVGLLSLGLADTAKSAPLPFGPGDRINLECLRAENGKLVSHRWLDGRTGDTTVGLANQTGGVFTGTRWQVVFRTEKGQDTINLKCLGAGPEATRWLDGVTADGSVELANTTGKEKTGTYWQVVPVGAGDLITLKCLGTGIEGNRWLVGRKDKTVGLAPQPDISATKWRVKIVP